MGVRPCPLFLIIGTFEVIGDMFQIVIRPLGSGSRLLTPDLRLLTPDP